VKVVVVYISRDTVGERTFRNVLALFGYSLPVSLTIAFEYGTECVATSLADMAKDYIFK
jgi:hypothetical protein